MVMISVSHMQGVSTRTMHLWALELKETSEHSEEEESYYLWGQPPGGNMTHPYRDWGGLGSIQHGKGNEIKPATLTQVS